MKWILVLAALAFTTPALAQTNDPQFNTRIIIALQTQRNQAWDQVAIGEANLVKAQEELKQAQARIKELETKLGEKKE